MTRHNIMIHMKIQLGAAEGVHSLGGRGDRGRATQATTQILLLHRRNKRHEENNLRYVFIIYY